MNTGIRWGLVLVMATLTVMGCDNSQTGSDASTDSVEDSTADTSSDVETEDTTSEDTSTEEGCTDNADCDDGIWCNGEETCGDDGECVEGTDVDCDDDDVCTADECDEDAAECVNDPLDADEDGFAAATGPGGETCSGTDCDDADALTFPGAEEGCDLVDRDCDDDAEEYIDDDGDGWIDEICDGAMTDAGDHDGFGDCDDDDDTIYPGAPEGCDGAIDNDCDGDATEVVTDTDGDGFAPASCGGTDCDDGDDTVYPGATELCDDVDQDCDGEVLDGPGADDDSDTVLDATCGGTDCDDTTATVHGAWGSVTEATEVCDAIDQDCDGSLLDAPGADDDADLVLDYTCGGDDCNDLDNDVYPGAAEDQCDNIDNDCDGDAIDGIADDDDDDYMDDACTGGDDCDDTDDTVYPGATEICDDVDNDCDGEIMDAPGADDDGDMYMDEDCGGNDCDDDDASIHPWASESGCDTIDNDCDGDALDGMADNDNDDYMDDACTGGDDCDDTDRYIHPGAATTCDDVDDDCSGSFLDEADADDDLDGYLDAACGGDDCNDTLSSVYPGATEVCSDGVDQDCDTLVDGPAQLGGEIRISFLPRWSSVPEVVWTGSEYGVVWASPDVVDYNIHFQRVSPTGALVGSNLQVSEAATGESMPAIAWSGSEYGIVFEDAQSGYQEIWYARVGGDGTKLASEVQLSSSNDGTYIPDIAWSGSEFGVVWSDRRGIGNYEIYFNRVQPDGTTMISDLRLTFSDERAERPSIAWTGTEYGISWHDDRTPGQDVYFIRVSAAGIASSSEIPITDVTSWYAGNPEVAWSGSQYGLAWTHPNPTTGDVTFQVVDPDGTTPGSMNIWYYEQHQSQPDLAWGSSVWGMVWEDSRSYDWHIYFMALTADGTKIGSEFDLSSATTGEAMWSAIDWSGSEFGIVWQDNRDVDDQVYFTRVGMCD